MNKVQDKASLHEKAVQAVASGAVDVNSLKRSRRKRKENRNGALTTLQVRPDVLEKAKELLEELKADHGYTRMEIVSENEVILR